MVIPNNIISCYGAHKVVVVTTIYKPLDVVYVEHRLNEVFQR